MSENSIFPKGEINYRVIDEDGNVREEQTVENVIVATLLKKVVSAFTDTEGNALSGHKWIGLGRGDTPETVNDTELDDEFEASSFGTSGGDVYNERIDGVQVVDEVNRTYTISGSLQNYSSNTLNMNESGIFTAATSGSGSDMGSRGVAANTIQIAPNEKIQIEWVWSVNS